MLRPSSSSSAAAAAWSSWSSLALVLFSNLALCSLRRPTTLIATFDTLLKNEEETKILTTVRKVPGWYEKSTNGTKRLWYEKSGIPNKRPGLIANKKLSYRRETARQLCTSFSARPVIVLFTEHCICCITRLYNRLAKPISTLSANKPCDISLP